MFLLYTCAHVCVCVRARASVYVRVYNIKFMRARVFFPFFFFFPQTFSPSRKYNNILIIFVVTLHFTTGAAAHRTRWSSAVIKMF